VYTRSQFRSGYRLPNSLRLGFGCSDSRGRKRREGAGVPGGGCPSPADGPVKAWTRRLLAWGGGGGSGGLPAREGEGEGEGERE
jgi:hypothetical protein